MPPIIAAGLQKAAVQVEEEDDDDDGAPPPALLALPPIRLVERIMMSCFR